MSLASKIRKKSRKATAHLKAKVIESGELHFSVEARLLRELGERLVKQPEVALIELIKNAYDADARTCTITAGVDTLVISDDGNGMTLSEFEQGWMRIGTSAKVANPQSRSFHRAITGEKGIGRFAVRFLGGSLHLRTVAMDHRRKVRTALEASFEWSEVDRSQGIDTVAVPYTLREARDDEQTGTTLQISDLRVGLDSISWQDIRTGSIGLLSPLRPLLDAAGRVRGRARASNRENDPGFSLAIAGVTEDTDEAQDVAQAILSSYVIRAVIKLHGRRLSVEVYSRDSDSMKHAKGKPELSIVDTYPNDIGGMEAEIRFFPKRKGSFAGLPVDGRRALGWIAKNSGVAIYDRSFRVLPYGTAGDDWLNTARDTARRRREPRSKLAGKYFPMSPAEAKSTELNYMLRLPHPQQLIGIVLVEGSRGDSDSLGLVPSADREGFVGNDAFAQLYDIVRGAVEAIAYIDRKLQKKQEQATLRAALRKLRAEAQEAIAEIRANPRLRTADKAKLIERFTRAQAHVEEHEAVTKKREEQLEILSLLGVVAGFMTHEFGTALEALEECKCALLDAAHRDPALGGYAAALDKHITTLNDFAKYSRAYIASSADTPAKRYLARPRVKQVAGIFGKYAADRGIDVEIDTRSDVLAPAVPVALYNGVALNLYTNALKAVSARAGAGPRRICFRAWNEGGMHTLLVADTGVGIPTTMRRIIFEPLMTTTGSNSDPLGSGLGLGLTLVHRAVGSFRGTVSVVDPPPGFVTAVEVKIPLQEN